MRWCHRLAVERGLRKATVGARLESAGAKERLKQRLLAMEPHVRDVVVKAIRLKLGIPKRAVKMKNGLTLDPLTNTMTVDNDRALSAAAEADPLLSVKLTAGTPPETNG